MGAVLGVLQVLGQVISPIIDAATFNKKSNSDKVNLALNNQNAAITAANEQSKSYKILQIFLGIVVLGLLGAVIYKLVKK